MPKKTFFNLDENKRKTIIDAAIKEFSRVGFDSSSIKNIVQEANIPRGSFYQYFKDKEDLYLFVMHTIGKEKRKSFEKLLKENNGDVFTVFEIIFKEEYKNYKNKKYHNLYKNFFCNLRYNMYQKINHNRYFDNNLQHKHKFIPILNKELYKSTDEESIRLFIRTLFSSMNHVIIHADIQNLSDEEALEQYEKFLNILKHGILKKD